MDKKDKYGFWVDDTSVNFSTSTDADGFKWYGTLRNFKPHEFMMVRLPNGQKYDHFKIN